MTNYSEARLTDDESTPDLRSMQGVDVLAKADGTLLALFESPYWLARLIGERPELTLEKLVAGAG
jgi:peptide chain release factor 3